MFAKLDARISAGRKKADTTPAAAPETPAKADQSQPAKTGEAPATPTPAATPSGPKALREQYEKTQGELKESRSRIAEMEKRIADAEARGKDSTVMAQRLADMEKEREQLKADLRAIRHEQDPEFKDKFDKPFNQAAEYAKREVEQLQVLDENGDPARNATWEDFAQLYSLPKGKAVAMAKTMFGDQAGIVISHMTDLQRMAFQKESALQEERANFQKREQEQQAKQAQEREAVGKMWADVNKDIADRHPEWYQPDPEDQEGNDLLQEGYRLVDSAFGNRNAMTLQQRVLLDANIRHRAAAFTRAQHQLGRAKERIAELEARIAEMEGGEPGEVQNPGGEQPASGETNWKDDLRKSLA